MLLVAPVSRTADLNVGDLRCEYRENPIGIDTTSPRFSWVLNSDQQAESQTAYQILVATTADLLGKDTGDLWDTGKVKSPDAIQIPYAGKALVSGERYFWKVRVWDKNDSPSDWTEPATWTMGLLAPGDWRAQWIGRGDEPRAVDLQTAQWIWPLSGNSTSAPGRWRSFASPSKWNRRTQRRRPGWSWRLRIPPPSISTAKTSAASTIRFAPAPSISVRSHPASTIYR